MATSKNTLFWTINTIGWGTVFASNLVLRWLAQPNRFNWPTELTDTAVLVLTGWGLTGLLRHYWPRWNLLERRPMTLLGLSLGLIIFTALLHTGLTMVVIEGLRQINGWGSVVTVGAFLANWSVLFFLHAVWLALYTSIHYNRRVQALRLEQLHLEKALQEARLHNLMGQLNPHYLFNALNNIRALMLEDVPRARTMLGSLSMNLRYALEANRQPLVPLATELEMVHHFMALSSIQLEERLRYEEDIEAGLSQVQVPPMLLQLLIENAIKHGISRLVEGGQLRLSIAQQEEALHIWVINDHPTTPTTPESNSTQIGWNNLQERLQLMYHHQAHFEHYTKDQQFHVHLVLPLTPQTDESTDR